MFRVCGKSRERQLNLQPIKRYTYSALILSGERRQRQKSSQAVVDVIIVNLRECCCESHVECAWRKIVFCLRARIMVTITMARNATNSCERLLAMAIVIRKGTLERNCFWKQRAWCVLWYHHFRMFEIISSSFPLTRLTFVFLTEALFSSRERNAGCSIFVLSRIFLINWDENLWIPSVVCVESLANSIPRRRSSRGGEPLASEKLKIKYLRKCFKRILTSLRE